MREVIWKPALEKTGIEYRPMMQTWHTFATITLSEGENIGGFNTCWVTVPFK